MTILNRINSSRHTPVRTLRSSTYSHNLSSSAIGNMSFDLGSYSYRVILNCRSEDGAANTTINDSKPESQLHTPIISEEVTQ